MKLTTNGIVLLMFFIAATALFGGCTGQSTPTPTPTPTPIPSATPSPSLSPSPGSVFSQYEAEYSLLASFNDVFWCDPDFYPIARPGQEEKNAQDQFPAIKANAPEFTAILAHLNLPEKSEYTDQEKLLIYREHKTLTYAVQMTPDGKNYNFVLRVGQNQGERIEGTITPSGKITVTRRETSFNTCPICLSNGTLIDTPGGLVPVERISEGMLVWTEDESGKRTAAAVVRTSATPVPPSFQVIKITLDDGRSVTASPGHPTAAFRKLGGYRVGEVLDGAVVVSTETIAYAGSFTYDLLPEGNTGLYWANGILLKSTLN